MSAGNPEVAHFCSRSAIEISLTSSSGISVLALDIEEGECARWLCTAARPQRAERLANRTVLECPMHRNQCVAWLRAQRLDKSDLFFRRRNGIASCGRSEIRNKLFRQNIDRLQSRSSALASTI